VCIRVKAIAKDGFPLSACANYASNDGKGNSLDIYQLRVRISKVVRANMIERFESTGQNRALLVGVNHYYSDDEITNLDYCVNDVIGLNDILSDKNRGNFTTYLLHSESDNIQFAPIRSNIISVLNILAKNSERNDSILFYFAGHGIEQDEESYLLPADAHANVLSQTAIPLRWIKDTLTKSLARKNFLIIDACHSGSRIGRSQNVAMSRAFQESIFTDAEGLAILTSCTIDEVSHEWPEKNHGVFSYYLIDGLLGEADYDEDHLIRPPDVYQYVSEKIRLWCVNNQKQQTPYFKYEVIGDFIFIRVPSDNDRITIEPPSDLGIAVADYRQIIRDINEAIENISFMDWEELQDNKDLFKFIEYGLYYDEDNKIKVIDAFLKKLFNTRFTDTFAFNYLMEILAKITEINEVKKMFKDAPYKSYIIMELITSKNWDYAGTMSQIINNILPVLTDDELLRVIESIPNNDQIYLSFKARPYLLNIIDSSKYLVGYKKYLDLMRLIRGES